MEAAASAAAAGGNVPELLALARLDDAVVQLQAASRHVEALACMEKALVVRQRVFGLRSDEVWGAAKAAGELCNLLALCYLQKGARGGAVPPRCAASRAHASPTHPLSPLPRGLRDGDAAAHEGGGAH